MGRSNTAAAIQWWRAKNSIDDHHREQRHQPQSAAEAARLCRCALWVFPFLLLRPSARARVQERVSSTTWNGKKERENLVSLPPLIYLFLSLFLVFPLLSAWSYISPSGLLNCVLYCAQRVALRLTPLLKPHACYLYPKPISMPASLNQPQLRSLPPPVSFSLCRASGELFCGLVVVLAGPSCLLATRLAPTKRTAFSVSFRFFTFPHTCICTDRYIALTKS